MPDSGFWKFIHAQWEHGEWVGWGFWDLIMPSFMFMVGMAMPFSHARRLRDGDTAWKIFRHTLVRAAILIALGIFLTNHRKPQSPWELTNTLAQIGLCYPLVFFCLGRGFRVQGIAAVASLVATWLLFVLHGGAAALGPGVTPDWAAINHAGIGQAWWKCSNVAHHFDVWFLNGFSQSTPYTTNAGGYQTLNFLPSLATMIAGLMCGEWVRAKDTDAARKLRVLLIAGAALLGAGELLGLTGLIPIVKRIWTPSFSLVSTGACVLMLAAFYWVVDLRGWKRWTFPLIVAGSNSIALYCMSMLLKPWVAGIWQRYLGKEVFLAAGPTWESVLTACAVGVSFWLVTFWMYRNKFFVRI
ncbi:MAG: DUF5009 domain-containing protein [Vicinamibacterales bacterium]